MELLIDTCTWLKLERIQDLFDVKTLHEHASLAITHEVATELEQYRCQSWKREENAIYPIGDKDIYEDAISLDFDIADASLLSNCSTSINKCLITEDRALIKFAVMYKFNALQLIDLFRVLCGDARITKNHLFKLNRKLRELRNITTRKEKEIKSWLAET